MFGTITVFRDTRDLLRSSGEMKAGSGLITSATALALGALSVLAVLTLHFPQYLTAPEPRASLLTRCFASRRPKGPRNNRAGSRPADMNAS